MKKILPILLAALVGLASCSKTSTPDPSPSASIAGTWSLNTERTVTTNKSTGAVTTADKSLVPGATKVSYTTNGTYQVTYNGAATGNGTYTYSGSTLTLTGNGKTSATTVAELSATKLVTVENTEDTSYRYTTTDTLTR